MDILCITDGDHYRSPMWVWWVNFIFGKKMFIAHYATTNNISLLKEDAKASVDYIFEKIQQVVEKENKK